MWLSLAVFTISGGRDAEMISLNCTNCRALIEMDDAFAGGVCRCRHCGAIQTVPTQSKVKTIGRRRHGRTLYSKRSREEAIPSSGLEQLAQAVASSGLSSELRRTPGSKRRSSQILLIAGGGVGLIVVLVCIWFARHGPARKDGPVGPGLVSSNNPALLASTDSPAATSAPNFCGIPLAERVVIYVLDRGSGTTDLFSYLKEAAFRSAESLGEQRKFQIIFWNNGSDDAYPLIGPTYATSQNVEAARKSLDGVYAHGQSDAASALAKAVAAGPDAIILATGKGGQLNDDFVQQVMQIRKERAVKIHTFDLGGTELSAAMKTIAEQTGGQAHLVAEGDLKRAARD